jgi:hypothetical protein
MERIVGRIPCTWKLLTYIMGQDWLCQVLLFIIDEYVGNFRALFEQTQLIQKWLNLCCGVLEWPPTFLRWTILDNTNDTPITFIVNFFGDIEVDFPSLDPERASHLLFKISQLAPIRNVWEIQENNVNKSVIALAIMINQIWTIVDEELLFDIHVLKNN